ncbi:MAG: glycerol-3-phosphate dehydrogenase [SAR324 cluster bacterium]|nr:glycerol-3-phosphate dehydrogenase [SAR324 cluster bacterium]
MPPRESFDLLVVGGGINGCAIARDAAGRGLSVLLCEQGDLAQGTSSRSSKLIHGGLRYLEQFQFRLVREALAERELLLRNAPHAVRPLRFVLPHDASRRPAWMIRLGLLLYDALGARKRLPRSRAIDLRRDEAGAPLKPGFAKGFAYADCRADDSRLVLLNALGAAERGASIRPRTRFTAARHHAGRWVAELRPAPAGAASEPPQPYEVEAGVLVNAAGPWLDRVMQSALGLTAYRHLRLVQGSHLVFPRLYEGEHAYILQHTDGRVVFAIPFLHRFTLVGTTDVPFSGDPAQARIAPEEAAYLCEAVNRYFQRPIAPEEAVWSYSGVRPLAEDRAASASRVSRDYVLELDAKEGAAPLLAVIGGKLTAHRELAEKALEKLAPYLPDRGKPWTAEAPLPGGEVPGADLLAWGADFRARHPWLPEELARRLAALYGARAERVVGGAASLADLGRHFGAGLYEREAEYLVQVEWARSAEDILWRRTKLGLEFTAAEARQLQDWLDGRHIAQEGMAASPPPTRPK